MKKLKPLTCKVLLRMVFQSAKKAGLIEFTDELAEQLTTYAIGIVVAMGDTAFNYAPESKGACNIGDHVYIIKNAGVVLAENAGYSAIAKEDQIIHRIVNDEDILCVEVAENE